MDKIITLSRQFGSGGKELALLLGEKLSVPVYDKEIIQTAAQESGIALEYFENSDEKRNTSFLFSLVSSHYAPSTPIEMSSVINDDNLFLHISSAIKKLASGPCIIVGRCGDEILKELNPFKVFVCGNFNDRVARAACRLNITEKEATSITKKTDKNRASYYNYYTGKDWGEATNYHLVINSSLVSLEAAAQIIIAAVKSGG